MALDPKLLAVLACPIDKGPLLNFEGQGFLYNPRLKKKYPLDQGVPVLLANEALDVDATEHARLTAA